MAVALVQVLGSVNDETSGTTTVVAPSSKTVTLGNGIVFGWISYSAETVSGVADNLGNTYTRVERVTTTSATADLWYAPVTTGGSITAITATHAAGTGWTGGHAIEISGMAAGAPAIGAGTTTVYPARGVVNKTIPAGGLAAWVVATNVNTLHTVGSASGSPSTTPVLDTTNHGTGEDGSLSHALNASEVTGFYGYTTVPEAGANAGAGAIFSPAGPTNYTRTAGDSLSSLAEVPTKVAAHERHETRP